MNAYWRLARLLATTAVYTSGVALRAKMQPRGERIRFRAHQQTRGSAILCRIFRIHVRPVGTAEVPSPTLIVCNHFGILDPFILASVLRVAFVGKAEIRSWPFFGWVARTYGVIFVYRDRTRAVGDLIRRVRACMRAGVPVLIFPEGTTSPDENLLPFKTGGFAAVVGMEGARILPAYLAPIRVDGKPVTAANRRLVTWADENEPFMSNLKRILRLRRVEVEIRFGEPFPVDSGNRKALADEAYRRVAALRDGVAVADTFPD